MQKDAQNGWVLNKRHEGVIYGLGWFFAIFSVIMWLFLGISYMIEKDHFPKPKHKT
ncbi:hypothetical protein HYS54_00125, partial [Candidatus Micrarchaeota archaeon]|nr:hypothetical protein [Candidatus Micrarchaeota archaeon]